MNTPTGSDVSRDISVGQPKTEHGRPSIHTQSSFSAALPSLAMQHDSPYTPSIYTQPGDTPLADSNRPCGPMSSKILLPARAKPGRKPIPEQHAVDRRRTQNRCAQRNFRDKRQQKLHESQVELEDRKVVYRDSVGELERQLHDMRHELREAQRQVRETNARESRAVAALDTLKQQYIQQQQQKLQSSLFRPITTAPGQASYPTLAINTSHSAPIGGYGSALNTPPEDTYPSETDFTTYRAFRPQQPQSGHSTRPTSSHSSGEPMDFTRGISSGDHCGFCTDDQNCACRNDDPAQNVAAASTAFQPGNCEACRLDPARAEACRDLARGASFDPTLDSGVRNSSSTLPAPMRVSCAALVDDFRQYGERATSLTEVLGAPINAYPVKTGGYEIEHYEAAQVLQNLSRRITVVSGADGRGQGMGG
ncbi:hypothetical protein LTR08_008411 [Meristemomyces frigidus]|nr:hypothetical protein LTR08_008411 [Meristemomyces frigidus]